MQETSLSERLKNWSEQHAVLMALAAGGVAFGRMPELAAALAAGSFWGLIVRFRGGWTPAGRFGPANAITLLRVGGTLALLLGAGGGWWPFALVLALLAADGLDGWAARRFAAGSEFGELFDQEVDAFLVLALCLILFLHHGLGAWVLLPGTLRYGFVLFSRAVRPPQRAAAGNRYTRAIGTAAILGLSLCLMPVDLPCVWPAAIVSLAVAGSFLYSARQLYRPAAGA
jgi:phosphatidylglycerophosphate synthase